MKRLLLAVFLVVSVAACAYAQWGGSVGHTYTHRLNVTDKDTWFPGGDTASSLELNGYNSVRVDYDVSGSGVSFGVNLQCSNDSLWLSGDSQTVTVDSWEIYDLMGCEDYNVYVESVSPDDSITIYVTPFNR